MTAALVRFQSGHLLLSLLSYQWEVSMSNIMKSIITAKNRDTKL
jgi:hypothetical protein